MAAASPDWDRSISAPACSEIDATRSGAFGFASRGMITSCASVCPQNAKEQSTAMEIFFGMKSGPFSQTRGGWQALNYGNVELLGNRLWRPHPNHRERKAQP